MHHASDPDLSKRDRFYFAGALAVLGVAVTAATCLSCVTPLRMLTRTPAQQHQATVTVQTECAMGGGGFGTGVIHDGRVITAAHVATCQIAPGFVVEGVTKVDPGDGIWRNTNLSTLDLEADLAVLTVPGLEAYTTPIEVGPVPLMGDVVCASTGAVPYYAIRCGVVGPSSPSSKTGDIVFDSVVVPGNSGSGLYDRHGRLVGIVVRFRTCGTLRWHQACDSSATSLWSRRQTLGIW